MWNAINTFLNWKQINLDSDWFTIKNLINLFDLFIYNYYLLFK